MKAIEPGHAITSIMSKIGICESPDKYIEADPIDKEMKEATKHYLERFLRAYSSKARTRGIMSGHYLK
jgi:hypothetical protein